MEKPILFFISHGHRAKQPNGLIDMGAQRGKFVEGELTFKFAAYIHKYLLEHRGKLNYKSTYPERDGCGDNLNTHVKEINDYRDRFRTVAIDCHFNAGGGTGCECWIPRSNKFAYELAVMILEDQRKMGRPLHGGSIKNAIHKSDDLRFLQAEGVTLLFEAGYVDNVKDRKDFDTDKEIKEMAERFAKSLIRYAKKYN